MPTPDTSANVYFETLGGGQYRPTHHVGGGWNPAEQHIAPVFGLLAHEVEKDRDARRSDGLRIGRVCYDILGVLPMDVFDISVRVLRPGRTIELVEATLTCQGRTAVVLRAWLMVAGDTAALASTAFAPMPPPGDTPAWDFSGLWPGGFVASIETRRIQAAPGSAQSWVKPAWPLLAGEPVSPLARLLGVVDVANGLTPLASPHEVAFPNIDLTAHVFRDPVGDWTGLATTVTFGPDGVGATHSIVHDAAGPVAIVTQCLTVRQR